MAPQWTRHNEGRSCLLHPKRPNYSAILPTSNDGIILVDTHLHFEGTVGAIVLCSKKACIGDLIESFEALSNQNPAHLGAVTVVTMK